MERRELAGRSVISGIDCESGKVVRTFQSAGISLEALDQSGRPSNKVLVCN